MNERSLPESGEIVVGVDGSAVSEAALRWALAEGSRGGRAIRVVHAWTYDPLRGVQTSPPVSEHDARVKRLEGLEKLVAAATAEGAAPTVRYELAENKTPVNALAHASRSAAMLVLGSHGYGRLQVLLGSVSAECVREAACPVVIIPARTVPEDRPDGAEPLAGTYLPGPLL